jgi:hypothetical protein
VAEEQSGFLGRWARRKNDVLQGKAVQEPVVVAKPVLQPQPVANALEPQQQQAVDKLPELSLEDVKLLTKDSDFKPFMAHNVGSDVRNAAMKKLFSDPHFNVMDGLDIYIDDYSKSDPIPEAMLRAMTSSKFLKLFEEEEDKDKDKLEESAPRENANKPADQSVAQSYAPTDIAEPGSEPHINPSQPELLPLGSDPVASQKDHDDPHL